MEESAPKDLVGVPYLKKSELISGEYYLGSCRNASIAKWDGKLFWYMREKFGTTFKESINHPSDDNGMDLFIPESVLRDVPERALVV